MTDEEKIINILENTDFHFSEESDPEGITAQNFCTAYNKAIDIVEKYSRLKEAIEKIKEDIKMSEENGVSYINIYHPLSIIDKHTKGLI